MRATVAAVVGAGLLSSCSLFGVRSGYEEPAYAVVERIGDGIEIRRYDARVAAEVTVDAADSEAGRRTAFRALFDYISGANRERAQVAMTAPVATADRGAEIEMTAPVATAAAPGRTTMRFFLPEAYTAETAPEPVDPRIRIVALPAETMAAARFTGSRDEGRLDAETARLFAALDGTGWRRAGTRVAFFYDPPWTLPFLRRNEIGVAVER